MSERTEGNAQSIIKEIESELRTLRVNYLARRMKELEEFGQFKRDLDDQAVLKRIQSMAHRIKGNAAMYGLAPLGELAAKLEHEARNFDPAQRETMVQLLAQWESFILELKQDEFLGQGPGLGNAKTH